MHSVRPAAVAGLFYPADPAQLSAELRRLLAAAEPLAERPAPKVLLVPHAGYLYSGPVAASAYAGLRPLAGRIRRVVLLGPAHRVALRGLALPAAERFATPLGEVELDEEARALIAYLPQVRTSEAAHALEHSLEVQLPFLQAVLGEFRLLPLAVGEASPAEVAEVLERLWGGAETLILISSDLSHYLPYEQACSLDRASLRQILAARGPLDHQQACGATPLNGLLALAERHGLRGELLDLRNSGDTAGDKARVVGYAAVAFYEPGARVEEHGPALLAEARDAIERELGGVGRALSGADWLERPGACFVTLTRGGRLRGCIGSLEAHRSLREDVRDNAVGAACRDPRFAPLQAEELAATRIEVSLLGPQEALPCADEAEALALLRPGHDGLVLEFAGQRVTFLPQVWAHLPQPAEFLAELRHKAGLAADFWHPELRLSRYAVRKWREAYHD
ncbi:AmmeMemoRadiSam system protein B [Pseudomonas sp. CAU 1711]|uniref:AmmeMemoRadiSam system protein B n=1 Tax=Pseudomonas sp. CAU 1711 TaxID=3140356 RepID=UPI0032618156